MLIQNARIFWNVASSWCWSTIPIQVFFGTVLFWDTCLAIGSILIAPPMPWPRIHRRFPSKRHSLKHFPRRWMILSALMINWSRGVHPVSLVLDSLYHTSSRMYRLNALVSLTPEVWCQFSALRTGELLHMFPFYTNREHATTLAELEGEVAPIMAQEVNPIVSQDLSFFDSLEEPLDPYFFDSSSTMPNSQKAQDALDFFDCYPRPTESVMLSDWMDLSLFHDETVIVHCAWDDDMPPHKSSLPSPNAYVALERGGIPHSFDDCTDVSFFSVIIDSGASLTISPFETDFIGTIKKLKL